MDEAHRWELYIQKSMTFLFSAINCLSRYWMKAPTIISKIKNMTKKRHYLPSGVIILHLIVHFACTLAHSTSQSLPAIASRAISEMKESKNLWSFTGAKDLNEHCNLSDQKCAIISEPNIIKPLQLHSLIGFQQAPFRPHFKDRSQQVRCSKIAVGFHPLIFANKITTRKATWSKLAVGLHWWILAKKYHNKKGEVIQDSITVASMNLCQKDQNKKGEVN